MRPSINWSHLHPKYSGQWVAFGQDQQTVISASPTLKRAINTAKKQGIANPLMFKVPNQPTAYVGQS